MAHTLTIYRERYTVEDDGYGGSDAVDTGNGYSTVHELTRESESFEFNGRTYAWAETPVRQAVTILRREYLGWQVDGGDWFGQEEPSVSDYGTGEYERVTGRLSGFSESEERAVIRMLAFLDREDARRTAEYLAR